MGVDMVCGVDIDIGFGFGFSFRFREYFVDDGAEVGPARVDSVRRIDGRGRGDGVARLEF